jgi:LysR family transcriptional activator of glutamate synthase operon
MELRQLRYFVAVARHGNFTRAAEALRLAQPALSQQIRRLENELQTELLIRSQRGARPTDAGEILLRHAARIEAELEAIYDELAQLSGALRGHVRLGITIMPRAFALPALLAEFRMQRPGLDVLLRSGTAATMERMLDSDELDLAFVTMARERPRSGLGSSGPLFREDIVALLPEEHRLAAHPTVPLAALAEEDLIGAEPGAAVREMLDRAFADAGLTSRIPFETNDPEMVRILAASRMGVAVAPRAMVEPAEPGFVILPIDAPRLTRDIALIWHAERSHTPAVTALKAFITAQRPPLSG